MKRQRASSTYPATALKAPGNTRGNSKKKKKTHCKSCSMALKSKICYNVTIFLTDYLLRWLKRASHFLLFSCRTSVFKVRHQRFQNFFFAADNVNDMSKWVGLSKADGSLCCVFFLFYFIHCIFRCSMVKVKLRDSSIKKKSTRVKALTGVSVHCPLLSDFCKVAVVSFPFLQKSR